MRRSEAARSTRRRNGSPDTSVSTVAADALQIDSQPLRRTLEKFTEERQRRMFFWEVPRRAAEMAANTPKVHLDAW